MSNQSKTHIPETDLDRQIGAQADVLAEANIQVKIAARSLELAEAKLKDELYEAFTKDRGIANNGSFQFARKQIKNQKAEIKRLHAVADTEWQKLQLLKDKNI